MGILCTRWTCPGWSQQAGRCREGTIWLYYSYHAHLPFRTICTDRIRVMSNLQIRHRQRVEFMQRWRSCNSLNTEHTMDSLWVCIRGSHVALWGSQNHIPAILVGWLVGVVHGWLLGDWVRRHQTVNGFLNSAEQPFAKACGTSVLLCWGLQQAANSGQWRESMTSGAPPPLLTKHTRTISLLSLSYLQSEVWMVSSDATALPIHC